jgi:hypothetical protein
MKGGASEIKLTPGVSELTPGISGLMRGLKSSNLI